MRSPRASRGPVGSGQFAGRRDPQALDMAGAAETLDGLLGDGAIRVSATTSRFGRYTAADINPQVFLALPATPVNANLETAAQTAGVSRNQLNRRRGAGR